MRDQASASDTELALQCLQEELESELRTFRDNAFLFRTMADQEFVQILEVRELRGTVQKQLAQMNVLLQRWNEVAESYRMSVFSVGR